MERGRIRKARRIAIIKTINTCGKEIRSRGHLWRGKKFQPVTILKLNAGKTAFRGKTPGRFNNDRKMVPEVLVMMEKNTFESEKGVLQRVLERRGKLQRSGNPNGSGCGETIWRLEIRISGKKNQKRVLEETK